MTGSPESDLKIYPRHELTSVKYGCQAHEIFFSDYLYFIMFGISF